jgi:hypothetical protein
MITFAIILKVYKPSVIARMAYANLFARWGKSK